MAEVEEKLSWMDPHHSVDGKLLSSRFAIFFHALLFVFGFSLIFVFGWGGAATIIGKFFGVYKPVIGRVGGIIVIGFGLANLGLLKIPWLYVDTRPQLSHQSSKGWLASPLMGMFFAAGWTPCIGTTLGAILTLGFSQQIWAQRNGYFLNLPLGGSAAPTYLIAVLAGLLSFLSPCVLPLVPAYMGYLTSHALKTEI
jgi:cytochrome c-type biogenesis protein